jgi:hypothetical protein
MSNQQFQSHFGVPHHHHGPATPQFLHGGLGVMVLAAVIVMVASMMRSRQASPPATAEGTPPHAESSGRGFEFGTFVLETVMRLAGHRR